jgi:Zn-dependent protease/CBS domain-containing protein
MGTTIQLGRVAGISIGVHWTLIAIFALITWSLWQEVLPSYETGLGSYEYLAMAVVSALLFFVSIILHELGHAVRARREGMAIDGITLWLLGGVASFRGDFPGAAAEFRVAIAGPVVSLLVGASLAGASLLLNLPKQIDGVVAWVGFTNLLLLAFNMLPALPLDGGRVLQSALWGVRKDRSWATRVSAGLGRIFGLLFVGIGLTLALTTGSGDGVWLALLGWFLVSSATGEAQSQVVRDALSGLTVRDVMIRDPVVVDGSLSVGELVDTVLGARRFSTYPVAEGGRITGLLPFRRVAALPRSAWDDHTVGSVAIPFAEAPKVEASADLIESLDVLTASDLKRALVTDGELVIGLLSISDVVRAFEARRRR